MKERKTNPKHCKRGPKVRVYSVLGDSFQAFFYKHETTYRGLKFHKTEQFNTKLLFENISQNIPRIYKKILVVKMRIFVLGFK